MEILYGDLLVRGDFELINIRERGFDRDFMLKPEHRVLNLKTGDLTLQFTDISRILIRAALETDQATVHFLRDTDLESAVANFGFHAGKSMLNVSALDYQTDLELMEKEER